MNAWRVAAIFFVAVATSSVTDEDKNLKASFPVLWRDSLCIGDCSLCFEKDKYLLMCDNGKNKHGLGCISCIRAWLCGFDDDGQLNSPACPFCRASLSSLQIDLCDEKNRLTTENCDCSRFYTVLKLIELNEYTKNLSLANNNLGAMTRKQVKQLCEALSKVKSNKLDLSENNFNRMDRNLFLKIKKSIPEGVEVNF